MHSDSERLQVRNSSNIYPSSYLCHLMIEELQLQQNITEQKQNTNNFELKSNHLFVFYMFEQKSCFAPKMFEQKCCFAPKKFEQKSSFASNFFEQKSWFAANMFEQKSCFEPKIFEQKSCFTQHLHKSLASYP